MTPRRTALGFTLASIAVAVALATPASAVIIYETTVGFRNPGFYNFKSGLVPQPIVLSEFSWNGALCPSPGTPNYVCGSGRSIAGLNGARLFLKSGVRFKRTDADVNFRESAAYADTSIWITKTTGSVTNPPGAAFYFGLGGTRSATTNSADVTTQAFAVATLTAGTGGGVQCFADFDCIPDAEPRKIVVHGWNPTDGFQLRLRADVAAVAKVGTSPSGWDAEVVAEFADSLELLAIQLLDENDEPIAGATVSAVDNDDNVILTFPNEPPAATATPTPTMTPTHTPTPSASLSAPPTTTATSPPTPTATVTPCANPPCEDCENCIDDDGDQAIDRADSDCPVTDAAGGGYGGDTGKALDKCAKAVRKAGAKLVATRLKLVQGCLKAVADCVQLKPGDDACLPKARAKCAAARSTLGPAETKSTDQIGKACVSPSFTAANLVAAPGLGFEGEGATCARRGIPSLGTVADVAECIRREHACAVERMIGATVPRAHELLALGAWNPSELGCLATSADGGGNGLAAEKRKAIRKCDGALQKAAAKLVAARAKAEQACSAAVFTCVETKPGDDPCLEKARTKCAKRTSAIASLRVTFTEAIATACTKSPLEPGDLLVGEGLGASVLDSTCVALGVPALASAGDLAACLVRSLECRVDQVLVNQTPRLDELLRTGTTVP